MLESFFKSLRGKGVKLWIEGEFKSSDLEKANSALSLKFKAYAHAPLSDSDRHFIKINKPEIIDWLAQNPDFFSYIPLSENQKSLWLVDSLDKNNTAYNLAHCVGLNEDIQLDALQEAFKTLGQRHQILRAAYINIDGEPFQYVKEDSYLELFIEHGQHIGHESISQWAKQKADIPFDLSAAKVCRANVLLNEVDGKKETIFQLNIHHIVADFWTCEVLFDELLSIYKSLIKAEEQKLERDLPDREYNYFDWLYEQRHWLQSDESEASKYFWKNTLSNEKRPEPLALPLDFPRPKIQSYTGEELSFDLDLEASNRLRQQAKLHNVTPYVFCLAVFQVLLYRYSGQKEFLIGTPSSGRLDRRYQNTVGYLVNPLVIACDFNKDVCFADVLKRVSVQIKTVIAHQTLPFRSLLDTLDVPRDPSRTPLFQHMFTLTHVHPQTHADMVEYTYLSEQRGSAHELNLVILDDRKTFSGKWRYNQDLFTQSSVAKILDNYLTILDALCTGTLNVPNQPPISRIALNSHNLSCVSGVHNIDLATQAKRGALTLFEQQVALKPSAPAFRCGALCLTYKELDDLANNLAFSFAQQGVIQNACYALYLERGASLIASVLAIWKLGASYVALDVDWPSERIQSLCEEGLLAGMVCSQGSGFTADILHNNHVASRFNIISVELDHKAGSHKKAIDSSMDNFLETLTSSRESCSEQSAYWIYTSGSTGKPKAVSVSQSSLAHYVLTVSQEIDLPKDEGTLSLMSLSSLATDLGHTAVYGALLQGHCLHLPTEDQVKDPVALAQSVSEHPVACIKLTPSHVRALESIFSDIMPSHCLVLGGEALSSSLVESLTKYNPSCKILNHYGPTEATVGVTTCTVQANTTDKSATNNSHDVLPIGRPLTNTHSYILDEHLTPVPNGVAGELYLSGSGIAQAYVNHPSLTSENFIPSPFSNDGERMYKTGDRARLNTDGSLEYLGRIDDQVKVRGYRVELGEVESRIRNVDGVSEAVVLLVKHEQSGSDQLIAYIKAEDSVDLNIDHITSQLNQVLPEYMVPSVCQKVDVFPRLASGKIDRKQLPKPELLNNNAAGSASVPAQNDVERQLFDIWCRVLNRNDFGIRDSFFDLGGDSILSLQIITQAKKIGIGITPKGFFSARTIEELAKIAKINAVKSDKEKNSLKGATHNTLGKAVSRDVALSPIQHWFFENQKVDAAHWNQTIILSAKERIDTNRLFNVFSTLVHQHEALHLTVDENNTQRYTAISADHIAKCFTHEESSYASQETLLQSDWFEQRVKAMQEGFQLSEGPLVKLAVFDTAPISNINENSPQEHLSSHQEDAQESRSIVVVTAHHFVVDGVSWRILIEDLEALYLSKDDPLKATVYTTDSYASWTKLLEMQAKTRAFDHDLAFWREQTAQASFFESENKTDFESENKTDVQEHSVKNTVENSRTVTTYLDEKYTESLIGPALSAYRLTINECLLSALTPILAQLFATTAQDCCIELESHGRDNSLPVNYHVDDRKIEQSDVDVSRTVGWFTSRYPVAIPSKFSDWPDTISQIKNRLRSVPNNGISYGIARYLANENLPSSQLLTFNYLGQVDSQLRSSSLFELSEQRAPHMRSPKSIRTHLIDLNMQVSNQRLQMSWSFPAYWKSQEQMTNMANLYVTTLMDLVDHCIDPDSGSVNASDFDDADISDDELSLLLDELN